MHNDIILALFITWKNTTTNIQKRDIKYSHKLKLYGNIKNQIKSPGFLLYP